MQSLLRWSIENTPNEPATSAPAPRRDLDPAIIDHILGKPDAVLMKESLAIALDDKRDEDDRVAALDEFEMLIEQIDNASNIEKLGMWPSLQGLLTSSATPDAIKRQALWVVGTAVQNNPSAQKAYLDYQPLPALLSFLTPSTPAKTRAKAIYAISGVLKHSAFGVAQLVAADGWPHLRAALADSDVAVRRKAAFLIGTLLAPSVHSTSTSRSDGPTMHGGNIAPVDSGPEHVHANTHASMIADPKSTDTSTPTRAALELHGLRRALVDALVHPLPHGPDGESEGDADFEEKVVASLLTYVSACNGAFEEDEKGMLKAYLNQPGRNADSWGLSAEELRVLNMAVA